MNTRVRLADMKLQLILYVNSPYLHPLNKGTREILCSALY